MTAQYKPVRWKSRGTWGKIHLTSRLPTMLEGDMTTVCGCYVSDLFAVIEGIEWEPTCERCIKMAQQRAST